MSRRESLALCFEVRINDGERRYYELFKARYESK